MKKPNAQTLLAYKNRRKKVEGWKKNKKYRAVLREGGAAYEPVAVSAPAETDSNAAPDAASAAASGWKRKRKEPKESAQATAG